MRNKRPYKNEPKASREAWAKTFYKYVAICLFFTLIATNKGIAEVAAIANPK